jgi:hypothetical protein
MSRTVTVMNAPAVTIRGEGGSGIHEKECQVGLDTSFIEVTNKRIPSPTRNQCLASLMQRSWPTIANL